MAVSPFETGGRHIHVVQIIREDHGKGVIIWLQSLCDYENEQVQKEYNVFLDQYLQMMVNIANIEEWSTKKMQAKLDYMEHHVENLL